MATDRGAEASLEFALSPDDLPRLLKLPCLARAGRAASVTTLWHDTTDGALAARALSLSEQRGLWRLEALRPTPDRPWPPGSPAPLVAEGASPASLDHSLHDDLAPIAALHARRMEFLLRSPRRDDAAPNAAPDSAPDAGLATAPHRQRRVELLMPSTAPRP